VARLSSRRGPRSEREPALPEQRLDARPATAEVDEDLHRLRETVLAQGGSREAMEIFIDSREPPWASTVSRNLLPVSAAKRLSSKAANTSADKTSAHL